MSILQAFCLFARRCSLRKIPTRFSPSPPLTTQSDTLDSQALIMPHVVNLMQASNLRKPGAHRSVTRLETRFEADTPVQRCRWGPCKYTCSRP